MCVWWVKKGEKKADYVIKHAATVLYLQLYGFNIAHAYKVMKTCSHCVLLLQSYRDGL